jgi:uncharacterized protein YegP (UPF0339 family)
MAQKRGRVQFFKDKRGEYRWRLKASNGEIIADSGEGYKAEAGCKNGYESVKNHCQDAVVEKQY